MAGLLSSRNVQTQNRGLLGGGVNVGGADDAARLALEQRLAAQQAIAAKQAMMAQPEAPPQRQRVSGVRMLDRILFGSGPIGAELDAERAQLEQEAQRPELLKQQQRLLGMARGMGPQAELAFSTNPEALGESLGMQYRPQVLSEGSASYTPGMGAQPVLNERRAVVGDRVVGLGGAGQAPRELLQVDPSFSDETARINATNPVTVSPGARLIDPATGQIRGQGADRILAAGEGVDLVSESGAQLYQNAPPPRAATARPQAAVEIEDRLNTASREVVPSLTRMRELLDSGDVITGVGASARLQADRVMAAAGNRDAQRRVAATEELRNLSGRLRVGMAKTLGANPSNADILLLEKITGGDISQNQESLIRLVDQGLQMSQQQRADLQRQLATFEGQSSAAAPSAPPATIPIAEDAQGNRVQWNGSAWVPVR